MTAVKSAFIFHVAKAPLSMTLKAIGSAVRPAVLVVVTGMVLYTWTGNTERSCPKRS